MKRHGYNRRGAAIPQASHALHIEQRDFSFLSRRLRRRAGAAADRARSTRSSRRRRTTWASGIAATTTRCRASEYLEWTGEWVQPRGARAGRRRLAVPERRRQADRPVDGARRRAGGSARICSCRTRFTGSSRSRSRRRSPARAPASTTTSRSATTSRSTAGGSSTTATSSSSTSRRGGDTPLDRQAIGVRYQDQSNVGALADGGVGRALPRQHLVHSLRDDPEPREGPAASGHLPAEAAGDVPAAARPRSARSSSPTRSSASGRPPSPARSWAELRRHRDGRGLSRRRRSNEPAQRCRTAQPASRNRIVA